MSYLIAATLPVIVVASSAVVIARSVLVLTVSFVRNPVPLPEALLSAMISERIAIVVVPFAPEPWPARTLNVVMPTVALPAPAYSAGSPVWARFEITGFKLGPTNAIVVEYGLAVFRADGQKLFEQAVAAGDQEPSFYPKRYVPGALSVNLTKDIAKAPYTIELTARDKIGKQTVSSKQVFTVE